ncbi:MAG: DUF2752 domain-containing protein [Planctomycetota bacterium]|nr:MAG: DUF2752 domain-containing protein [Planctomycetota bacterium]
MAAFVLEPDRRGVGTHEQLGLPPCGFFDLAGGPCPSCGFTTTFAYAAHLRPLDALANQPFGFFVFLLACAATVVLPPAVVRGVSLFALTERWRWRWVVLGLVSAWLAAWAYKWHITVGF